MALIVVVAIGAFLRIEAMNDRDFWGDEAFTGIVVRQPWPDMMEMLVRDVHPPLYYWLLKGWSAVLGAGPMALRAFSVFFGVATIALAFLAMRDWVKTSPVPALLVGLCVAVNPFLVAYSHEARMYALLAFLVMLSVLLLTRAWSTSNPWYRVGYAVALTAMIFVHYLGALFAIGFFVVDVAHRLSFSRFVLGYFAPGLASLLLFRFFQMQQEYHQTLGWVPEVEFTHIAQAWEILLFGSPVGVYGVPAPNAFLFDINPAIVAVVVVALLFVVAVALTLRGRWDGPLALLAVLSSLPLVGTWALQFIDQALFVERYLIGASVTLILFIVLAFERLRSSAGGVFTVVYLALLLFVIPPVNDRVYLGLTDDLREVSNVPIVFTDPNDFIISRYYLGDDANIYFYNAPDPSGDFSGWSMIAGYQIFALPIDPHIVVTTRADLFSTYALVGQHAWLHVFHSL